MYKVRVIVDETKPKEVRDLEADCRHFDYQEFIGKDEEGNDIPNPQTKARFMEDTFERIGREASKAERTQEALKALVIED